jgi:predicted phage-related endonuclease
MLDWKYSEDGKRIILVDGEPRSKLKVTGTRLAGILGLNKWNTPFQMWCEITKCARPPFEDTIYTLAGKAIEPKQIKWTKEQISENVLSPEEFFGNRYSEVKYDFYPNEKIYGGMWDSKLVRPSGKVSDIFEYKTTKRAEDWVDNPPVYYLCQALEYAYLEGAKRVHLIVSFLEDNDYNNPQNFVVDDSNTQLFTYDVDKTYIDTTDGEIVILEKGDEIPTNHYNIKGLIELANKWYDEHIKTGFSPVFDEVKDKEYLDILRTSKPQNDLDDNDLVAKANELIAKIDAIKKETGLADLEKQLEACEKGIKEQLSSQMGDNDTKAVLGNYTLSKTVKEVVSYDVEAMELDGVLDKYEIKSTKETLTLRKKK